MLSSVIRQSKRCCVRSLHYVMQRDTDKLIPHNDVFIRTSETVPILTCRDFMECCTKLSELGSSVHVMNGVFVVNAAEDNTDTKMRKFRGTTVLPTQLSDHTVLAVCEADQRQLALDSGAKMCLTSEQLSQLDTGEVNIDDYDIVVCTPKIVPFLARKGKLLRNKMPHVRKGTISANIKSAIKYSMNVADWETVDSPNHPAYYNVNIPIAKSDFDKLSLEEHVTLLFDDIMKHKPAKQDTFIERVELHHPQYTLHVDIRQLAEKHKQTFVADVKRVYSREEVWELRENSKLNQHQIEKEKEAISNLLEKRWETLVGDYR